MVRSRIISCFKRRLVFVWVIPCFSWGCVKRMFFGAEALVEKTGPILLYSDVPRGKTGIWRKALHGQANALRIRVTAP